MSGGLIAQTTDFDGEQRDSLSPKRDDLFAVICEVISPDSFFLFAARLYRKVHL